jgi:ribonucleotide monophosphatase NagD (HAD superfamily)
MVGDRLNTDIKFGKAGGLATLLVLTGAGVSPHFPLPLDHLSKDSHDLVVRYHLGGKSDGAQPIDYSS